MEKRRKMFKYILKEGENLYFTGVFRKKNNKQHRNKHNNIISATKWDLNVIPPACICSYIFSLFSICFGKVFHKSEGYNEQSNLVMSHICKVSMYWIREKFIFLFTSFDDKWPSLLVKLITPADNKP